MAARLRTGRQQLIMGIVREQRTATVRRELSDQVGVSEGDHTARPRQTDPR